MEGNAISPFLIFVETGDNTPLLVGWLSYVVHGTLKYMEAVRFGIPALHDYGKLPNQMDHFMLKQDST